MIEHLKSEVHGFAFFLQYLLHIDKYNTLKSLIEKKNRL